MINNIFITYRQLLLVLSIIALTSCSNFRPLYNDDQFSHVFSTIEIEEVETLQNTEIYHQLTKLFGTSDGTKYLLKISIRDTVSPLAISSKAEVVAQNVTQLCHYTLVDKNSGKELTHGQIRMIGSYNALSTPYASYTKEQYTKTNLSQATAEELRLRLMMYFSNMIAKKDQS
jgi:hypothetical protein